MIPGFRKAVFSLAVPALLALVAAAYAKDGFDTPVARVNSAVLTEADLQEEMDKVMPSITIHGGVSRERLAKYRPEALKKLIEGELFYQEAVRTGLRVEGDRIKKAVKELSDKVGGKGKLEEALKVRGLTMAAYEKMLERFFLVEMFVKQEITDKSAVSDDEVRAYYERNKAGYLMPEARRLSHILISVPANALPDERERKRKVAVEVQEKAARGEDFSRLAWDYSDDPYKYKGGDLGLIHKGRLDPAIEDAVLKLKVGEVTDVVETIYGFHIVKLQEVKEPVQLEFADVSQKIKTELTERKKEKLREDLLSRLKANAVIEVY